MADQISGGIALLFYASDETIERIRTFVRSEKSEFDFNNVIPMPAHTESFRELYIDEA